jgi:hypothetical protein
MRKMNDWERVILRTLFALSLLALMVACTKCQQKLGLQDDWAGEEIAESIIKQQTGLDIDLTPGSPE